MMAEYSSTRVSPHLIETVRNRLAVASALLPEWSRPDYTERYEHLHRQRGIKAEGGRPSITPGLKNFLNEAMADIRRTDLDPPAPTGDSFGARLEFRPIYPHGGFDPERFVLATVGQDEFPRSFPVKLPVDIVAFGLHGLGSLEACLRFLGYLIRVYSDAVRLTGDPVGLGRELVRSLGILACALRDLIALEARYRAEDSGDSAEHSNEPADQSDPIDSVERTEKGRQEASPSVGGNSRGCAECGCSGSKPAEGEGTNQQATFELSVAETDDFVRAVDRRLERSQRMRGL